jgi:hypothetical protein
MLHVDVYWPVSNESLKMEVDTGAAVSVMNEDTYTLSKKNTQT